MSFFENLFKKTDEEHYHKSAGDIQEEILLEEKEDMIQGIEDLSETSVKEVMVPRIDVDFVSISLSKEELLEKFREHEFSRFPVYSESIDNVVGILHIKDVISALLRGEEINIEKVMRKPFFVPESKRIDTLLREFKRRHVHIAIAIDEYGGVSGIVCLEDIIEEIVGNIQDEFDDERDDISPLGDNAWICDTRVDLDDLNEELNARLPDEEFDTLGGFVFDLFGKIPVRGEKVTWGGFEFVVHDIEGHRINSVKIVKVKDGS